MRLAAVMLPSDVGGGKPRVSGRAFAGQLGATVDDASREELGPAAIPIAGTKSFAYALRLLITLGPPGPEKPGTASPPAVPSCLMSGRALAAAAPGAAYTLARAHFDNPVVFRPVPGSESPRRGVGDCDRYAHVLTTRWDAEVQIACLVLQQGKVRG